MPESEDRRITPEQVLEVLQSCYDPCCKERSVSVVELGLIQGVKVAENGHDVRIELLLTSGWCPFSTHLLQMIDQNVGAIEGVGRWIQRSPGTPSGLPNACLPARKRNSRCQWRNYSHCDNVV